MFRHFATPRRATALIAIVTAAAALTTALFAPSANANTNGYGPQGQHTTTYGRWGFAGCSTRNYVCSGYRWNGYGWDAVQVQGYGTGPLTTYGEQFYFYPSSYGHSWIWSWNRQRGWVLLYGITMLDPNRVAYS